MCSWELKSTLFEKKKRTTIRRENPSIIDSMKAALFKGLTGMARRDFLGLEALTPSLPRSSEREGGRWR